ncbi:MAG: hypothetical protein J6U54_20820 [Clostridiales bacterium]|nr:hypothetical protein [Clostridiales bacterium]
MFFLVIIQNNTIPAIYAYQDYDEALARFHTEMAYRSSDRYATACSILDRAGNIHKQESWGDTELRPTE